MVRSKPHRCGGLKKEPIDLKMARSRRPCRNGADTMPPTLACAADGLAVRLSDHRGQSAAIAAERHAAFRLDERNTASPRAVWRGQRADAASRSGLPFDEAAP